MFAAFEIPELAWQAAVRAGGQGAEAPAGGAPDASYGEALASDRHKAAWAVVLDAEARPALVCGAGKAAQNAGVELGQTAAQAQARHPAVEIWPRAPWEEARAVRLLLQAAALVSPVAEVVGAGQVVADLTALPSAQRVPLAEAAGAKLADAGWQWRAGLAATPTLALLAASQGAPLAQWQHDSPAEARARLAPLPVGALPLSAGVAEILRAWGIRTLGQVAELGASALGARLGPVGIELWQRAVGEGDRPLRPTSPTPQFVADWDASETPWTTLEPLHFALRRLLEDLAGQLQEAGLAAGEAHWFLRLDDSEQPPLWRRLELPEATAQAERLFRLLAASFENVRTTSPIVGLRLRLVPVAPVLRQRGLFEASASDPLTLGDTQARLVGLVGADRVGVPVLWPTHRPDAWSLRPLAPEVVAANAAATPGWVERSTGPAWRRFRPPLPVAVTCSPEGQPLRVADNPVASGPVQVVAGPFPLSGDWWDTLHAWRRQEWEVAVVAGRASPLVLRLVEQPTGWTIEAVAD